MISHFVHMPLELQVIDAMIRVTEYLLWRGCQILPTNSDTILTPIIRRKKATFQREQFVSITGFKSFPLSAFVLFLFFGLKGL